MGDNCAHAPAWGEEIAQGSVSSWPATAARRGRRGPTSALDRSTAFIYGVAFSCFGRYLIVVMTIRTEVLPVGPPVQLEWQIGRTRDIEQVRLAAENGEHVVLIDVRRTGKSTVALGAIEQLAHSGALVFVLDASENAPDSTELARRLQHQLAAYRSAKNQLFSTASHAVRVLFDVGLGSLSYRRRWYARDDRRGSDGDLPGPAIRRSISRRHAARDCRGGAAHGAAGHRTN
jgi:hypothetical protein